VTRWPRPFVWFILTLPLAPAGALVYALSEWLFFATKPSTLSALPFATEVGVLTHAALPALLPLLAIQALASAVSTIGFPRLRPVAVVPAAMIGGAILLLLLDNFTYTLFGFGVLTTDGVSRVVYAAVVPALAVFAGHRLLRWIDGAAASSRWAGGALAMAVGLLLTPLALQRPAAAPDRAAPPPTAAGAPSHLPNIVIIGIDGVDATALSAYGYERDTSPYLAHLRDESLFFENAFSNVGRTHGSLVALLTGRLPFSTRVTFPPTALSGDDAHRHLPGLLKPLGYTSLQLGMRHYADAEDANLLGFDAANYRWQDLGQVARTSTVDEAALFRRDMADRLDERIGHLFGWRHAVDVYAHVEGKKESPFWKDDRRVETLTRYLPSAPEPFLVHTHFLDTHCCSYHPKSIVFSGPDRTRDALDSQLREADDNVRAVVESLRVSGRLDHTIVVITSDHTNGWTTKGRVPLLIRFPGKRVVGRVRANAQLADVVPTLLDYLDQPVPDWVDGISLLDETTRERPRPIFGISEVAERHSVGVMVKALDDAGPPNYGAGSATLIAGSRWYELSLADGRLDTGDVPGHTNPEAAPLGTDAAEALLRRTLAAAGFEADDDR
jgi:arylsulfatase A-like enzyme